MKPLYTFDVIAVCIDNRPSSEGMPKAIVSAIEALGYKALYFGVFPAPALANYAITNSIPSIMVTGSHIHFDRNGLNFYRLNGEITKADEVSINQENGSLLLVKKCRLSYFSHSF